ncbi:glycoside hydrolase family 15 protein [Acidisoma sp.]|uniref:glycoside hydrolase family 15 protein n=1 Tax=Acidisoma sp. TaxID=1872115 RepID=UPI003B00766B
MSGARLDGELPLDRYAAIGDGRSVAIVGADGSIDWWCVPHMDSVPFFDRLLDPWEGGRFSVTPVDAFEVARDYLPDSNVLVQTFTTASGRARLTDGLNSGISGRLPWSELARRIEGLEGEVEFRIECRPGHRLGHGNPWREDSPHGDVLHIDGVIAAFRATDDVERVTRDDRHLVCSLVTSPGSRSLVAILASGNEPLILPPLADIDARLDRSSASWQEWARNLKIDGPYASTVRRSALALKLLLFSPSGATAAAATNSLPERLGGTKNYDYRYAWVRDVAYTIKAFLRVGATEEAKAAFSWLMGTIRRHGMPLHTMYRLDGDVAPAQETLDLPGYRGSRDVLLGNKARDQLQLGTFGDILETAALFVESGHVLDLLTRRLLGELVDRCADMWMQKDAGIWELDEVEHYTMSKMGCWTALDRGVRLAEKHQIDVQHAGRWRRERDRIRDWVDANCWSDAKQSYTMHPGTERLDAALLLATRFGFERRDRLAATRDAVVQELARGPLVYRYSGMEREEGTFTACGFWLVEAFALLGDLASARRQMDGMLERCGTNLGLLTEMIDARSGEMLGNLPQALSHLALVHAAFSIGEAEQRAPDAGSDG